MRWLFLFIVVIGCEYRALAEDFSTHGSADAGWIPNTTGATNAVPTQQTGGVTIESVHPDRPTLAPLTGPAPERRTSRTWGQAPLMTPVLTDSGDYETEDNWLASIVARRIVDFARAVAGPVGNSRSDFKVTGKVDAVSHRVHVEITGDTGTSQAFDLQPQFAWDGHGYAPLARDLVKPRTDQTAPETVPDELSILQNLTGPTLAHEDVEVSEILKKHPASAAAHEDAALLLVGLALRDNAGNYSDSRRMLGRATAHLALAEALRGKESTTWAGKIADAGIRALAGREIDTLSHLDTLENAVDCPASAKDWITALRLRAKDDWRLTTPHPTSSLLLKIVWFQVLSNNLSDLLAIKQFEATDEFTSAPDWGHAVLANRVQASVEGQNRFCKSTLELELVELAVVLQAEGRPLKKGPTLGAQLADPLVEQLYSGPNGELRVIGPDMFMDFARQHLILELYQTYWWYKNSLGLDADAETFRKEVWPIFRGMRLAELTGLYEAGADSSNVGRHLLLEEAVVNDKAQWHPWEIAAGGNPGLLVRADQVALGRFYRGGLPFGTVYNLALRGDALSQGYSAAKLAASEPNPVPGSEQEIIEYMRKSPWGRSHPIGDLYAAMHLFWAGPNVIRKVYPPARDLLAMAPSSFQLFACDRPLGDLLENSRPWWDYNLVAIHRIEVYSYLLDEAFYEEVLRKHAKLDPDANFRLGAQLREEGKDDEAAIADRQGFDLAHDQVEMSISVGPLVDYYYRHDRKDEALAVAKRAGDVYSESGLWIYSDLLEKMNKLTDAAHVAQDIFVRYQNHERLNELFTRHPDFFHDQNEALMQEIFPRGLKKVSFSSFTAAPQVGVHLVGFNDTVEEAGLKRNDVIVALDSYLVENPTQYNYIRAMKRDDHMEIILWRGDRYLIAHTSAPGRRFGVRIEDYTPSAPHRLFAPSDE